MKFEGVDFYNLTALMSEEERMIQSSVREFVNGEILPIIEDCFQKDIFPKHLIPEIARLGMFGSTIHGYGCAGLDYSAYGLIMQEIERGDSGLRSFISVQGALAMHPIATFGTEEQKKKYLPKMAAGEWIGCFGLTEADFGSNPGGMITRARRDGSDYILNGSKMWITNGSISQVAIIWAKDDNGDIIGLIVDTHLKGFTAKDIHRKFSLRASVTSELVFEDVRVPAANVLQVKGLKGPFSCLNVARYGISWGVMGAAGACFETAVAYAKTRIQFEGKPIASHQLVQAKLANMFTEITKGQLLAYHLGKMMDAKTYRPQHISMAKMNNVSAALRIARDSRDILGASGITHEYPIGRHMMNLESVNTYEGTEDIHRLILGQEITGIPAY